MDTVIEILFWITVAVVLITIWFNGYLRGQVVAWRNIIKQDSTVRRKLEHKLGRPQELKDKDRMK